MGRYTPISASFAGQCRENGISGGDLSLHDSTCVWVFSFFRGFHVYIHVLQDKPESFSNMYEYMQETDMERLKKVDDKCLLTV